MKERNKQYILRLINNRASGIRWERSQISDSKKLDVKRLRELADEMLGITDIKDELSKLPVTPNKSNLTR